MYIIIIQHRIKLMVDFSEIHFFIYVFIICLLGLKKFYYKIIILNLFGMRIFTFVIFYSYGIIANFPFSDVSRFGFFIYFTLKLYIFLNSYSLSSLGPYFLVFLFN